MPAFFLNIYIQPETKNPPGGEANPMGSVFRKFVNREASDDSPLAHSHNAARTPQILTNSIA